MKRIALVFTLLVSYSALGQPPHDGGDHRSPWGMIRIADTDGGGDVTLAEWQLFLNNLKVDENGEIDGRAFHQLLEANKPEHDPQHRRSPKRGGDDEQGRPPRDDNGENRQARRNETGEENARGPRSRRDRSSERASRRKRGPQRGEHPLDIDKDGIFELEDLQVMFSELDTNSDGVVDANEMPEPPQRRGPRH